MKINFIDLKKQQEFIKEELNNAISNVLSAGEYIMGKECQDLEQELASYTGTNYCLGCANGTDAIRLALKALEVKKNDYILTTDFTFFATSEVIIELGAIPIFVDINETYNICPIDLEYKLKLLKGKDINVVGILSVDLFGLPAAHHKINKLANEYGLWHVEDAAQGFGGKIDDAVACSFGHISTTSFFPAKPLGCYGDGGAVFTDDAKLAKQIMSLRVHGKGEHKYENIQIGYNSRLDTIQAAILLEKLKIFNSEIDKKNQVASIYSQVLSNHASIITPQVPKGYVSSWAQYTLRVENREELMSYLKERGIPTAVYYPKTMSQTKALNPYLKHQLGKLENSVAFSKSVLSLPMHAYLKDDEIHYICSNILSFYGE